MLPSPVIHWCPWWSDVRQASFKDSNGDGYGDLRGIIAKLNYIKDIGVDCLWLCPIYRSPQVSFPASFSPNPPYPLIEAERQDDSNERC
jgi:glycosidase